MRLLIDGYNLLHASDLFGSGQLAGTLRGSREALLDYLAQRLTPAERRQAVIVFDASQAPPGLPDAHGYEGLLVRFARGYPDADSLLEEILASAKGTKQLTVVSGDRRVQRAARSVGATPVESDSWLADLAQRETDPAASGPKPSVPVGDAAHWIDEFSDPEALSEIAREAANAPPPKPLPPSQPQPKPPEGKRKKKRGSRKDASKPETDADREAFGRGILNPFPPGYAEELLDPERDEPSSDEDNRTE